jgi:hypothetical protein
MSTNQCIQSAIRLGALLGLAGAIAACGSSPSGPSTTATLAGISLSATSIPVGSTAQGTVTLAAPAPSGGLTVALSSSNPSVATVQTPVTVAPGASNATVSITAVAQGSTTISATLNGKSQQSPTLTVTAGAVLTSLSLSSSTVVGGNPVIGTVALSAIAPTNGAVVSLSADGPATVPASVTVPAGSSSAVFTVTTRAVGGTLSSTITASYGGKSASAALSVTQPTQATASFGVTGPTETETCNLTNNTLLCTFNGSSSTAPGTITAWDWTYGVAKIFAQTTSGPVLTMPAVDCSIVPPPPFPAGVTWFNMTVTLKVHDSLGNVSNQAVNTGVRLFPQGVCGF